MPPTSQPKARFEMHFSPEEYADLARQAQKAETSIATIVRRALGFKEHRRGERTDLQRAKKGKTK